MLLFEKKGPVAYLTLNRPEADNALDAALEQALDEALAKIVVDDELRVIVVRGAGGKAFSVGLDLSELAQAPARPPAAVVLPAARPYWQALLETDRIAVAALQGKCLGRGLELAMACDIRIAAEDALFGLPEVSLGTIPSAGGTQLLPRLIPRGLALEAILTAQTFDALEAYRIGLLNQVVGPDQLAAATDKVVETLLASAPIALKYAKESMSKGLDLTLEQAMRLEADFAALLLTTEDRQEGIGAFLAKRPPKFVGR